MKNITADIVIVGGGTAGMAAAVEAAENKVNVMVIERTSSVGGTARMGSGIFAVESRLQKIMQETLTREEAFRIYMDYVHWRANARLVKNLIDMSAGTIDWLERMGVKFRFVASHNPGFYNTFHVVDGPTPGHNDAAEMMRILEKKAGDLGVRIFTRVVAEKIVKENNRIEGVICKDESGEDIFVKAGALILATGGFYIGALPGGHGEVGDGIRLASEAGAAVSIAVRTGSRWALPGSLRPSWVVTFTFQQPCLIVNLLGERFINEEIIVNTNFSRNAIARQKGAIAFNIFDEATKRYFVEQGFDYAPGGPMVPLTKAENFDIEFQRLIESGSENYFMATSLEELAQKTGINYQGLVKTVTEYNHACETGRDMVMNKPYRYLRFIKSPPFYAGKMIGWDIHDWGGIKVNDRTEVLTPEYEIIPGLYAAGMNIACELYHGTYPFILPATAMGFAINSRRLAASSALVHLCKQ